MKKFLVNFIIFLILVLGDGSGNTIFGKSTTRVGILPFQIFSGEKVDYLKDLISTHLGQQLKEKGELNIIPKEEIQNLIVETLAGEVSLKELDRIARETDADFLIYGSLTKVDDNLSIDARVYSPLEESSPYKDFVEGKDLDRLIESLRNKISQHITKVALKSQPREITGEEPSTVGKEQSPQESELGEKEVTEKPSALEIAPAPSVPSSEALEEAPQLEAKATPPLEMPTALEKGETQGEAQASLAEPAPSKPSSKESEKTTEAGKNFLKPKGLNSDQPINITSDRMEADNRNRTVNFLGNVVAKREDMIIFSDQISTFYTQQGKIDKITARGNVKINQSDRIATCQEATFFQLAQKIVLTGKPKVWQGKNIVTGEKITILLNEDRIDIEGGKQDRVNAIIYPRGKTVGKMD